MYKISPYMEGILGDAMKATVDVDVDDIKGKFRDIDASGGSTKVLDKMDVVNSEGIQKAKSAIDNINSKLSTQKVNTKSIIARARKSILQFPIYCSNTLQIQEAHTISKLFERVYASMVQTVIAQNQIISPEEANNLLFLKNFHTNLTEAAKVLVNEYYKPIDELDAIIKESVYNEIQLSPNATMYFCSATSPDSTLIYESARQAGELLEGFMYLQEANDNSEKTDVKSTITSSTALTDDEFRNLAIDEMIKNHELNDQEIAFIRQSRKDMVAAKDVARLGMWDTANTKVEKRINRMKNEIKSSDNGKYGVTFQSGRYIRVSKIDVKGDHGWKKGALTVPRILKDVEIKKLNAMEPWPIEAIFRILDKRGAISDEVRFILGVKSVLHLIQPKDVAEDLRELTHGDVKSLRKVRYKSGELNFWDYVFDKSQIKKDALKRLNGDKRWMTTLKRMREFKRTEGSLLKTPAQWINGKKGIPIPNGTIIFTQTDVDYMKGETGIDLSKVGEAKRLARALYLIGVVIVDSASGTMKVLFPDMDTNWDHQSLAQVDAELAKTDSSKLMKELNSVVNRRY